MKKQEFLDAIFARFPELSKKEREERLEFYREMIDDRIEDGLSEEEAVAAMGSVDSVAPQILSNTPTSKTLNEDIKPKRRLKAWVIVLLALGSPVWLSLGIAAIAVILSLYITLWAVVISLWASFASLAACFIGGALACGIVAAGGNIASGVAMLAAGIVCAGLSIFMFYGCKAVTDCTLILTKKIPIWIKNCLRGKEGAQ